VGTNGNILLLGLGSIKAANRTLNDIQTEVRNILIRNGLAPSFQLEISKFKSKKAFVIGKNSRMGSGSNILSITNLPLTLREVGVNYDLKPSSDNTTIITLTRNSQRFRMTVGQLFDLQTPDIFIQDKDQIEIDETLEFDVGTVIARVGAQGKILLPGVGSIHAVNRTLADLHNEIYKTLTEKGFIPQFQLELTKFESKKAYLISKGSSSKVVPLTNSGMLLKELILSNGINIDNSKSLSLVKLLRNGKVFSMTTESIYAPNAPDVWIQDGDQIEITNLNYKQGQVFALSGAGNAKIVTIDPSKRETLADILFVAGGALSNVLAKRSEVYLLRGRSPSVAYHLDAQNVSRILVAAQTELRPNDIVYVADRPIISFSRTLAELNPLRVLLRDLEAGNIP
jgi:protein involved in polysaccharide export with SLBB domain